MKRLLCTILALPLLFAVPEAMAQDAEVEAAINEAQDRYAEAWSSGDAGALADMFTEDAIYWAPIGGTFEGRDEIRGQFEVEFEQLGVPSAVDITSSRVERVNGIIVDIGTFTATMPEGEIGELRGEYVVLAEETDDGVRIRRLIGFPQRQAPQGAQ